MKQAVILGIAFATAISLPALADQLGSVAHHRHLSHHGHRNVEQGVISPDATARGAAPLSALPIPGVAPYPDGRGDEDGLSRDPNDCNKGCIGGNSG